MSAEQGKTEPDPGVTELAFSETESRRFGLRTFRGQLDSIDPEAMFEFLNRERVDLAIVRLPSVMQDRAHRLDEIGVPWLVADTLVHYTVDFARHDPLPLRNADLKFRETTADDTELLNELIEEIFPTYRNHYHSNPWLNHDDILEGYKEWARNFIAEQCPGRTVWLAERDGRVIAMATCVVGENDVAEGVLYGVTSEASGGGIYGDLIRHTQADAKRRGYPKMKVSTQAHNYAVQKVWSREGFHMTHAEITIHINAFFDASMKEEIAEDVTRTSDEVLEERIIGCVRESGVGPEWHCAGRRVRTVGVSEAGAKCRLRVTFPVWNDRAGRGMVLARLSNAEGRVTWISYMDFRRTD